jgi:hypothetical protein
VIEYFDVLRVAGIEAALHNALPKVGRVKLFNGYYDKSDNPENVVRFIELMIDCYLASSDLLVGGPALLSEFFPKHTNPAFRVDTSARRESFCNFFSAIADRQRPARFYPYHFVERVLLGEWTLFRLLSERIVGKRVLVVTPFEKSIHLNFARRHEFFKDYTYPDFELLTYNTPITYPGLPSDYYPDANWCATTERMKNDLATYEFDLALLSCGSYAMPLGLHIRDALKRKAIYVGGCLQLLFGIMGRRYSNKYFLNQINADAFIYPVERESYMTHITVGSASPMDAFGAYF